MKLEDLIALSALKIVFEENEKEYKKSPILVLPIEKAAYIVISSKTLSNAKQ